MCRLLVDKVVEMLNYCIEHQTVTPINRLVDCLQDYKDSEGTTKPLLVDFWIGGTRF